MFDVAPTEFLLVAVVALLVIGPKDLPKAMRFVGHWVGRMRGVARQFRSGFDSMVREAELEEMEKRWAAENERIMREHGSGTTSVDPIQDAPAVTETGTSPDGATADDHHDVSEPIHVEKPEIRPSPHQAPTTPGAGVTS